MILGPVTLVDCLVFLILLAPQLVIQAGFFRTVASTLRALPFLLVKLPLHLYRRHYSSTKVSWADDARSAKVFEDLVVGCVRYSFCELPLEVGRVFFDKWVVLPFLRWRMLRHGYLDYPVHWREFVYGEGPEGTRGILIQHQPDEEHDLVVYYVHGGGFAVGTAYFYLEFLLAWHDLLVRDGYKNPAIFALEYTLVPDAVYPTQLQQVIRGYSHALDMAGDASRVCAAGDSAGGNLILGMLQVLGSRGTTGCKGDPKARQDFATLDGPRLPKPRMATLISPWVTLMTKLHYPSSADYLSCHMLWQYAQEYAGGGMIRKQPASPGCCLDEGLWRSSSPDRGYFVIYGGEEVFYPDIESFLNMQQDIGVEVGRKKIEGGIHAWPVASIFLADTEADRLAGLRCIVSDMATRMRGET